MWNECMLIFVENMPVQYESFWSHIRDFTMKMQKSSIKGKIQQIKVRKHHSLSIQLFQIQQILILCMGWYPLKTCLSLELSILIFWIFNQGTVMFRQNDISIIFGGVTNIENLWYAILKYDDFCYNTSQYVDNSNYTRIL